MPKVAAVGRNKAANGGRFRHAHERQKRSVCCAYSDLRLAALGQIREAVNKIQESQQ